MRLFVENVMRVWKQNVGGILIGSALLVAALGMLGCPPSSGQQQALQDLPPFSEEDAIILAKLEAKSEGVQVETYTISTRKKKESWWVQFQERPAAGMEKSRKAKKWPHYFVVEIAPTGKTTLTKNL